MRLLHHIVFATLGISLLLPLDSSAQQIQEVQFNSSDMALDLTEAKTFQKYPTYNQYLQMMQDFASDYPAICQLDTFGTSVEGRLLLALKISDNVALNEEEASFLYTSTMHGDEIVGFVLLLRMADVLLKGYDNDAEVTKLVDNLEIWINPLANPDGSYTNDNNLSLQHSFRYNVNSVDLNRDFPIPNKGETNDPTGRALETRHMMEFLGLHRFSLSANIHSGMEVVNYPWDNRPVPHVDSACYRFVSGEYADEAMAVDPDYMFGWPEGGIVHGYSWYQAVGTRQDYINYYLGGREVTLELSMEQRLISDELERHWNLNQRSLINYMSQCTYGIRGTVTDRHSGDPLKARIEVINHDKDHDRSAVYSSADHGDFYRLIKEGIYDLLITADGYFDQTIRNVSVMDFQATYQDVEMESWPIYVPEYESPAFRIYPNPSSGLLYVEPENLSPGELILTIHSLDGKLMMSKKLFWQGGALELDIDQLENGMYFVKTSMHSHRMVHRLLVIDP
ncbi:MAG: T9SS type A sorting domain-containing protein [Bacteroidia bacterium]|nr:MAG: T9SS type A sorting domain-containing protein [Bacteroidia bacterium]